MKPKNLKNLIQTKVVGLTGGIGSGKSFALRYFKKRGSFVLDADDVTQEIWQKNSYFHQFLAKNFQTLDKQEVAKLVFQDKKKRKLLESVVHPLIQSETEKKFLHAITVTHPHGPWFYEASLLFETGRYRDFKGTLFILSEETVRIDRLKSNRSMSEEQIRKIFKIQMSDQQKKKRATWIVENSGSKQEFQKKLKSWFDNLLLPSLR